MPRYSVTRQRGWSPVIQWRIRARVTDDETGDFIEFRSLSLADHAVRLLDRASRGDLPTSQRPASSFATYDLTHGKDGWWIYIWHGDGAIADKAVGRSHSESLARQAANLLVSADARPPRRWRGVFRSYF